MSARQAATRSLCHYSLPGDTPSTRIDAVKITHEAVPGMRIDDKEYDLQIGHLWRMPHDSMDSLHAHSEIFR
jgi:hypothetical protein